MRFIIGNATVFILFISVVDVLRNTQMCLTIRFYAGQRNNVYRPTRMLICAILYKVADGKIPEDIEETARHGLR